MPRDFRARLNALTKFRLRNSVSPRKSALLQTLSCLSANPEILIQTTTLSAHPEISE